MSESSELVPEIYRRRAAATLIRRDVITAGGPETETFLQGQLSQDVAALAVGESAPSFLLQPMGKVDAWLRVTRTADDEYLLDLDAGHGEATLNRLNRFKLRTKSDLTLATLSVKAVRSAGGPVDAPDRAITISWGPVSGYDLFGVDSLDADDVEASSADFETLRLLVGVPAMGSELTEDTIPAEAGVVEASVSFTKGCYTGQELVARIDSRGGNVPKHLRGVVGVGAVVGDAVIVDGDEVGTVTSVSGGVALAYVKRAVESFPASAEVGGGSVEIRELPLI
ncbi:MAG: hypothetical protein AAF480_12185 [Actinomycetota bacterium]